MDLFFQIVREAFDIYVGDILKIINPEEALNGCELFCFLTTTLLIFTFLAISYHVVRFLIELVRRAFWYRRCKVCRHWTFSKDHHGKPLCDDCDHRMKQNEIGELLTVYAASLPQRCHCPHCLDARSTMGDLTVEPEFDSPEDVDAVIDGGVSVSYQCKNCGGIFEYYDRKKFASWAKARLKKE